MKERRKFISILFLFLIMGNFIIGNMTTIVNATGTNLVEDEITENLSNISTLKNKINELKLDPLYLTDNALSETVKYMEKEILILESELETKKNILEKGILLKDLINDSFVDKKTIYETFFINDETVITPTEINDIKYMEYNEELDINEEKTLLTKEEIANALYNTYLKVTDEKITGYLSVFDTTKESYINTYNGVKTNKDNKVSDLETKLLEITTFYDGEVLNGNVPNMVVADTDIRTYIENSINDLNEEVASYTFEEMAEKTNNLDTIYNDTLDKINTFYLNNKSYTENGLKEKIESFNGTLNTINDNLANEIVLEDYKNEDVSKLLEAVDINFITALEDIISSEEDYKNLEEEINTYLDRKPSDKEEIDGLLVNINNLRTYLNKDKALKIIELIINNENLTNEDKVDTLMNFKDFPIAGELKEKLDEAKLSFYELKLKDNTLYDMEIIDDNIVLSYIKESLLKENFVNNLDYGNFKFEVIDENNITNNGKVVLYDRNDTLLKEYLIVIKGDINKDNILNIEDLSEFEEKLVEEELNDFVRLDLNDDKKINIYDVVLIRSLLEEQQDISNATESNFKITERKCETSICYDVEIITNGVVKGFEFDLTVSNNLTFEKLENNDLNIKLNKDNTKVYGVGEFINGNNFTLCYKKDLSVSNTKVVGLNNVKFMYDNLNTNEVENIKLVTVEVEEKESSNVVNKTTPTYTYVEEPIVEEVIEEEEKEEKHIEEKEEEEEQEIDDNEVAIENVIKIIIIVLLGAVIIYFLNKKDNEDEEFLNDDKKEQV